MASANVVGVAVLVAEAEDGGALAAEVEGVEFLEHVFPVALELAVVPGRDAEDQAVEIEHLVEIVVGDIKKLDAFLAGGQGEGVELCFQFCGSGGGMAVGGAVKDADTGHGQATFRLLPRLHLVVEHEQGGLVVAGHREAVNHLGSIGLLFDLLVDEPLEEDLAGVVVFGRQRQNKAR